MMKRDAVGKLVGLLCVVPLVVASHAARAQAYPSKPITAVVYGAAGTSPDVFARAITRLMSASMKVPFVVENRPGASGVIATEEVVSAKPDGYTLLFTSSTTLVNLKYVMKHVPFDSQRDLTPIGATFAPVEVLLVRSGLPVHTLPELIALAKQHPGDISYGAAGYGSIFHLNGERFANAAGIKLLHVAYKGPLAALQDVAAGNVDTAFNSFGGLAAMVSTGRVRIIATLDAQRYKGLPNVPTVSETLPDYRKVDSWFAMMGPAKLPQPIVERLNDELNKALRSPQMVEWMEKNVATSLGGTPGQISRMIQESSARTGKLVSQIGLQPE
ncbi:Bug family tripartite tricarboxylate transporter substrate binding protein [Paraburkholderia tropica]|uniref:Bug family tripartite tricarboxylate transporter substrate binding protein n=1 Tax=Paraburkholderia tropica TaxID=92647 RepID=UPI0007FE5A6B|nr:tripartite tricarboxylate transporter substrate binding protein [Paraburkholderia tropica]OBR50037.1 hypothetical protein A6456_33740 [Paraburkholderia tropica]